MAKSILQDEKECLVCKTTLFLEEHHCIEGPWRNMSERYGLKVWLCPLHHRISNDSVHLNETVNKDLKKWAQKKAMLHYDWSTQDFIERFGKNYVLEETEND